MGSRRDGWDVKGSPHQRLYPQIGMLWHTAQCHDRGWEVDVQGATPELAGLLRGLKERSNLSYEELARRTFTSSSALHRYCRGQSVPGDYGTVARIAQECGARPQELNELVRSWTLATNGVQLDPDSVETLQLPDSVDPDVVPSPDSPPVEARRQRRPFGLVAAAVAVVVGTLIGLYVAAANDAGPPAEPFTGTAQSGPKVEYHYGGQLRASGEIDTGRVTVCDEYGDRRGAFVQVDYNGDHVPDENFWDGTGSDGFCRAVGGITGVAFYRVCSHGLGCTSWAETNVVLDRMME